jgi:hypothetical protein
MTRNCSHQNDARIAPCFEPLEARNLMSAVPVALRVLGADSATEGSGQGVRIMVSRAKALSEPTRVFFSIDGTARQPVVNPEESVDYILDGMTVPDPTKPQLASQSTAGKPFVVIPAGQKSTIFTWTPVDDSKAETTETATFTIEPNAGYRVQNPSSATVSIFENDFRINFQQAGAPTPAGYIPDTGLAFGPRAAGISYGWESDISAKAAVRNKKLAPDARYDSFLRMQAGGNHKWEIAVPNGTYMVRLVSGDSAVNNSDFAIRVEDRLGHGGKPKGIVNFFRTTGVVKVTDGRLTVANALGSFNNKINFIEIKSVARRTKLGLIAAVSAPLKRPDTAALWHEQPNGLFADDQIDEPLWADFGSSANPPANPTDPVVSPPSNPLPPQEPVVTKPPTTRLTPNVFAQLRI